MDQITLTFTVSPEIAHVLIDVAASGDFRPKGIERSAVFATPAPEETAAAKKRRVAKEKRAAKKTAKEADAAAGKAAVAEVSERIAEEDSAAAADLMDDAADVTLDDLKAAVKVAIDTSSIDSVKAVFKTFDAAKISDLAPENYAAVKSALVGA